MGTVTTDTIRTLDLFRHVEVMEDVARRSTDLDRVRLFRVVREQLDAAPPVRVVAAAKLLDISERTVRTWVAEGVLTPATPATAPRMLLDTHALHAVLHAVNEVRAAGGSRTLLDDVYRRLVDATWLERSDLSTSIDQMRRGERIVRVPRAE